MGIGIKLPKNALECTISGPRIQKFSEGGPPDPLQETISFKVPLKIHVYPPSSLTLRTLQTPVGLLR